MKHQFQGKSLDEAVNEAARHFQVDKSFISYEVLSEEKSSLFSKLFSRQIKIEAWVENIKEDLQLAARKAVEEVMGKTAIQSQKLKNENYHSEVFNARTDEQENRDSAVTLRPSVTFENEKIMDLFDEYCGYFFDAFEISSDNVSIDIQNQVVKVHVQDEFLEDLLTKRDKLALSFEHIFKRIAQKKCADVSTKIILTSGESEENRKARLENLAKILSQKAIKTGRSVLVSYKSAQERKIIHLFLDGNEKVGTKSIGIGEKRKLVIYPKNENRNENRNYKNNSSEFRQGHNKYPHKQNFSKKKNDYQNQSTDSAQEQ